MPESDKLDRLLNHAAAPDPVPSELLQRISGSILPGLEPARKMPSKMRIAISLELLCLAIGLAGALLFGIHARPENFQPASVAIAILLVLIAHPTTEAITPGKGIVHPAGLLLLPILLLGGLFACTLHGYSMQGFVHQGVPCLRAGLLIATPTGVGVWLILRQGYALEPAVVAIGAGTLAGLAGVFMLALHCPIVLAVHAIVWHLAVVPVSALAGALLTKLVTSRG